MAGQLSKSNNNLDKNKKDMNAKNNTITNNRNTSSSKNNKTIITEDSKNYLLIPFLFVLCIIPFLVRLKVYKTNMTENLWFSNLTDYSDFFLYYKQWALVFAGVIMAIIILVKIMSEKKTERNYLIFIPLGIYVLLALLSSIFSDHAFFSFVGSFEEFESVFALISYGVVVFYAFLFVNTEHDFKTVVKYFMIAIGVMCLLGLAQFLGHDFFTSEIGYKMMVPMEYRTGEDVGLSFGSNRVFLTLYNPNYAGVYASLILPMALVLLIFQHKIMNIVATLLIIIGLILSIIGSQSLTAFVSVGFALFVYVIFMWRNLVKRIYITAPVILVLIITLFVMNGITDNFLINKLVSATKIEKTEFNLSHMETADDHVSFTYKGNTVHVSSVTNDGLTSNFVVSDENGQLYELVYNETSGTYLLSDSRFAGIELGTNQEYQGSFYINIDGKQWYFTNLTEDGTYYYVNQYGKLDKMITADSAIFTGYEWFASRRGYIWSRTIPLLKDHIFLGSGPDTFIFAFPQQDYMYLSQIGFNGEIITKPHSLFLQIAIQTGVLSLIAFLAFYGIYFVWSVRLYIKGCFNSYFAKVGLAIFIGSISYMIAGITNDSSITTAPIFWCLMGIGIAANFKAKPFILAEAEALKQRKAEAKIAKNEDPANS